MAIKFSSRAIWKKLFGLCIGFIIIMNAANANSDVPATMVRMEFSIQPNQVSSLEGILSDYSQEESFDLKNIGRHMPPKDGRPVFYVILRASERFKITFVNITNETKMIMIADEDASGEFRGKVDKLVSKLKEKWPDIHAYSDT